MELSIRTIPIIFSSGKDLNLGFDTSKGYLINISTTNFSLVSRLFVLVNDLTNDLSGETLGMGTVKTENLINHANTTIQSIIELALFDQHNIFLAPHVWKPSYFGFDPEQLSVCFTYKN